ncbi:site-specific DNA-methyltransferase (adenine-specific) [Flavobacterium branchiophilum]|uniref:site-specific DNA-methyltransferase (adenine-specific) n=1 Tax=Flavobacterium branchiophilum (strain FL-15) TaxID=1034807 RepID=G2Z619_FLABF|nr:TaqI-like C-terminal specificity domain-containing protein [Flavobacterium branchiophilum]CCB68782.1 Probable type II endonuclease-methyltransferase fusion protein [Flavobacterium branchiophilum FL-15]
MIPKLRKTLNKAFLKIKPNRSDIEKFKINLIQLLDSIKEKESEEFHKNLISDFLKNTYYSPNHFINTKGRNDLVIHTGKDAKTNVGVILEAKSPSNKAEMLAENKLNNKAFQELVLYFLRERITHKNLEIKNLVVTNVYEWYLFDAQIFDKLFAQNKNFVKQFQDFEEGKLSGTNTDFFYKEIAKPYIDTVLDKIECTYFDLKTYDTILRNSDKEDDAKLIVLYKLLSPEHLLKLSFANDSNTLDKNFYNELLHLIGLTETKAGGKKLIERPKAGHRFAGSLLENAINQLESLDKISRLPNAKQYGETHQERLFHVGLELCITWVNRILFLKLLEAQLISYHNNDKSYAFLNKELLNDYDNLNALFFMVLAKQPEERNDRVKKLFEKVPYLNSSLFEPTELEHQTLFIAGLENDILLPYLSSTVIKDTQGKKRTGETDGISYFFDFLDAYDFASEGSEAIQEDNKTLINASVLGLIFEKINGYKDGSFYTPSFITMYMCKETIRRAVVQKFNETKGWNCTEFEELYNKIDDTKEANTIINSLKICDPAVGSGHFLVSALNEIIAIKHDLRILYDRNGKRLKEYQIDIVNDELIVTDEDGMPFVYNPKNPESQRIQETLFHEKQTIIENCLFGVDINPNSVKICRLRLWIELLKNAYYKSSPNPSKVGIANFANSEAVFPSGARGLETLPNIDINIKCGNSLISRFGLDADLKKALQQSKWTIDTYKNAVNTYRNAESKEQKREMERLIADIKSNFRSEITLNDPKKLKLEKQKGELYNYTQQVGLFERNKKEQAEWNKMVNQLTAIIKTLENEIEDIKNNKIYDIAFEWRFEFPEVLNNDGDFVGFDVVIGNPPYFSMGQLLNKELDFFEKSVFSTFTRTTDIYCMFIELSNKIGRKKATNHFIISNKWLTSNYGLKTRNFLLDSASQINIIDFNSFQIFDDAAVDTCLLSFYNNKCISVKIIKFDVKNKETSIDDFLNNIEKKEKFIVNNDAWKLTGFNYESIKNKIESKGLKLEKWNLKINRGITTGYNDAFIIQTDLKNQLIAKDSKNINLIKPLVRGRDINKYYCEENTQWIIYIPKGFTIKSQINYSDIVSEPPPRYGDMPDLSALFWFEKEYNSLYLHLVNYKSSLIKRMDKGDFWWELRACAYLDDFEKEKIIFTKASKVKSFALDYSGNYLQNTSYFISGDNLRYLTAVLNSRFIHFSFLNFYQSGGIEGEITIQSINNIPIPKINELNQQPFINKVDQILSLKKDNPVADTSALEREIDLMVYELYGLSEEEIGIVEKS